MAEILDLYDKNMRPTGETVKRGERMPEGRYLLLVSIMTVDRSGRILLTRRAPEKRYAGRWEITGGCVQSGETAAEGARRELLEETGIRVREKEMKPCGTEQRSGYFHVFYLVRKDLAADAVRLQPGETDDAKWVTPEEFLEMAEQRQMIPHHVPMILSHYARIFGDAIKPGADKNKGAYI